MKAKALAILSALQPDAKTAPEYLALQGGLAQQLKAFDEARRSYLALTEAFPHEGRYWLGLAIAYDGLQNSQQARHAYRQALRYGLSATARNFVHQRLQQLGDNG